MFFSLSKLVGHLILPVTLVLIMLSAAPLIRWLGLRRLARFLGTVGGLALLVMLFTPLDDWLLSPLEGRFPQMERQAVIDGDFAGIIVLGGAEDGRLTRAHGQPAIGSGGERFTEAAILSRLRPDLPVVFTGGSGFYSDPEASGGPVAEALLLDLGVPADRLLIESRSRDTWENATFTRALVGDVVSRPWILITSAYHMPRSYGVFTTDGWNMRAYPVDYNALGPIWGWNDYRFVDRLWQIHMATREWLGLLAYRLSGRLEHIFPAPVDRRSSE